MCIYEKVKKAQNGREIDKAKNIKMDQVAHQSNSVWVRKLNLVNLVKRLFYSGNLDLRKNI